MYMRKFLILFTILATIMLMVACKKHYVEETYPFETFCEEFLNTHKDFNSNNITREAANKEFIQLVLDTLEKDNILKGLPIRLNSVDRCGDHITAHFRSWTKPSNFEFKKPIYEINYDIICTIPDSLSTILKDEEYYTIDGQFISRIENIAMMDVLLGRKEFAYTDKISIESDIILKDEIVVNMGILYFDIKTIEPFKGRNKIEVKN